MIRRLFWMLVGVVLGLGASIWMLRVLRIRVLESTPGGVVVQVGGSLRRLGADLRDAADEGRSAMQEREAELRLRLEGPPPGPPELLAADPMPQVLPARAATLQGRHRSGARSRRLRS
ncbi:hypothetical protein B7486_55975 [cyanobacterium TDX16]|nr:hypothetical protein B7486_55975 [cyanobacterium TDX16]